MFRPTVEDVLAIHEAEVGSPAQIREPHLLEAAVAKPWQSAFEEDAYPSLHLKAAVLYEALSNYQPFVDGNKRTALLTVRLLYSFSGYHFTAPTDPMLRLAEWVADTRPVDFVVIAQAFEEWAAPIPYPEDGET